VVLIDPHGWAVGLRLRGCEIQQDLRIRKREVLTQSDLLLHTPSVFELIRLQQRYNDTAGTSTGRSAGAVNVGLMIFWWVVVDDKRDTVDVDSTGSHVGCDECLDSSRGEVCECTCSLILVPSTVNCSSIDTELGKLPGQTVTAMARATKDDGWPLHTNGFGRDSGSV